MKQIFYKGVLESDLKLGYIPGTVTNNIQEALLWMNRISSKKTKGAAKHSRKGKSVIVKFEYCIDNLMTPEEFQREGVKEHERNSCWTSSLRVKAQINESANFEIVSESEYLKYC